MPRGAQVKFGLPRGAQEVKYGVPRDAQEVKFGLPEVPRMLN